MYVYLGASWVEEDVFNPHVGHCSLEKTNLEGMGSQSLQA